MSKYLLVDADGVIANVFIWDGVTEYTPPPGYTVHAWYDGADIGLPIAQE